MDLNSVQLLAVEYAIAIMGLFLGYKCLFLKKENMNFFRRFVIVLDAFALVNIPIRYIELHLVQWNRTLVFLLYAASVILMTYTMVYWFLFVLKQIKSPLVQTTRKRILCAIPALGIFPLCIINYWTGWLYVIDENSWYERGSIFILQSLISYGYFFVIIICNLRYLVSAEEKSAVKKCFASIVPAVIGAILQIMYGGSYLLLGTVFGGWIMYIEICLDRQKAYELADAIRSINDELTHTNKEIADNMRTILALSDIYNTLYEIDLEHDTFTEIKAMEVVHNYCTQFESARACMEKLPEALYAAAYVGMMKTLFDSETINECLKNTNSYFIDAIGKYSKNWVRTTMTVVERDDAGNVLRVVFSIQGIGEVVEQQKKIEEVKMYEIHAQEMKELFIQTAEALAGAIDAKDKYTHGHSVRVANYSRKIAQMLGMSETECEKVYFAGLLHDVGKIGIKDTIICKEGKLTPEEYDEIKKHPASGKEILEKINRLPYLGTGAYYHHERYDGKGYPMGLAGEDIPKLARIIAVADAYDAMTSKRSYRNPIPQQTVREELVRGMETQFDPELAKIMVQLIDMDFDYQLREDVVIYEDENEDQLLCGAYRSKYLQGIRITDQKTRIHFVYEDSSEELKGMPAFVFFDALDARIHNDDGFEITLFYHEYGELKADGSYVFEGVRKTVFETTHVEENTAEENIAIEEKEAEVSDVLVAQDETKAASKECYLEVVKDRDHLYLEMQAGDLRTKATMALPDSTRYVYVSITGENCFIHNVEVDNDLEAIVPGSISRIAEEITYLRGLEGDIPSIQVDGVRTAYTEGILLDGDKEITFDTKSLPFARLLWHCPFILLYSSKDGQVYGEDYKEYSVIRLNGESVAELEHATNLCTVNKSPDFPGWEEWKKRNILGRSLRAKVHVEDNKVTVKLTNGGIAIENVTTMKEPAEKVYLAFTGDQCVVENIHIMG